MLWCASEWPHKISFNELSSMSLQYASWRHHQVDLVSLQHLHNVREESLCQIRGLFSDVKNLQLLSDRLTVSQFLNQVLQNRITHMFYVLNPYLDVQTKDTDCSFDRQHGPRNAVDKREIANNLKGTSLKEKKGFCNMSLWPYHRLIWVEFHFSTKQNKIKYKLTKT